MDGYLKEGHNHKTLQCEYEYIKADQTERGGSMKASTSGKIMNLSLAVRAWKKRCVELEAQLTALRSEGSNNTDDCGNCKFKLGCKFSPHSDGDTKLSRCLHYVCCYEAPTEQTEGE